jgi:hypothetical protein
MWLRVESFDVLWEIRYFYTSHITFYCTECGGNALQFVYTNVVLMEIYYISTLCISENLDFWGVFYGQQC